MLAIVQGISEKFVTISAQQAALEHDYDPDIIGECYIALNFPFFESVSLFLEWLLVTNGIVQCNFAILIAYWGNRIHKITWLCGLVVFQSVTCLLIIFPTLTHSERFVTILSKHYKLQIHLIIAIILNTRFIVRHRIPHSIFTLWICFVRIHRRLNSAWKKFHMH